MLVASIQGGKQNGSGAWLGGGATLTLQGNITHAVRGTLHHPGSRYAYTSWIMSPSAFPGTRSDRTGWWLRHVEKRSSEQQLCTGDFGSAALWWPKMTCMPSFATGNKMGTISQLIRAFPLKYDIGNFLEYSIPWCPHTGQSQAL